MLDLYFYRDPEKTEKEEKAIAEKAVTKGEFQLLSSLLLNLKSQTGLKAQVLSVPVQQFPTEDWSAWPATEDWSAGPTAQAIEWVGTTTD